VARVLLEKGDRLDAPHQARAVWQSAELSAKLEVAVADTFAGAFTVDDDIARMGHRLGAKDFGAAIGVAERIGSCECCIVKCWQVVMGKAWEVAEGKCNKAKALITAVPEAVRADLGYALCRLHWLLTQNDVAAAVKLLAESSGSCLQCQDSDEWWRERRILAR